MILKWEPVIFFLQADRPKSLYITTILNSFKNRRVKTEEVKEKIKGSKSRVHVRKCGLLFAGSVLKYGV